MLSMSWGWFLSGVFCFFFEGGRLEGVQEFRLHGWTRLFLEMHTIVGIRGIFFSTLFVLGFILKAT